ncbi:MAG: methyltransferase domain-containing protein [Gammaproteobacteria bacterium]|nr:methyltransferase domain-containing protein [Gammaproteobacteria bacterium]
MARNLQHSMLPRPDGEELARQRYVLALKTHLGRRLRPGNRIIWEQAAQPAFERERGRPAADRGEIAEAMYAEPGYQTWSALNRCAQEMMWEAVGEAVFRDSPRMREEYVRLSDARAAGGSLELADDFPVPNVIRRINIHLQPGGYARDEDPADIGAGAFYEAGGALYSMGQSVGTRESKAELVQRFLAERYPGFRPARVLDMACSAGGSSVPYALAWPDAEVHAIDVGPGMLRYAHARAEALGARVHFHQRDVTDTGFADGSFDLVVSHNAMHEMSQVTQAAMMHESFRLLAPGGVCVHQDVPLRYAELDEFTRFERGWDLRNNNEPFWEAYATNDPQRMLAEAGFPEAEISVGYFEQLDGSMRWFLAAARKPA